MKLDPVRLEIFKHLFASIAEEMGTVLRKSSFSPNIKERRDYSCAIFDADGGMVAQAAHIPVHLGSMPLSVAAAIHRFPEMRPGDVVILNDPFRGGTHLPDITMVTPVFGEEPSPYYDPPLLGYTASRAHHADVGGMTPGSMPLGREIYQEGLIIPPMRFVREGEMETDALELILANVRTPEERRGDLLAQLAANRRGAERLADMVRRYKWHEVTGAMSALLGYTERMTRNLIASLPDGIYCFSDCLDDNGLSPDPVWIRAAVTISGDRATVDFTGSAPQQPGSVNAVEAITLSAVYYVFRCLIGLDVPNNAGCLKPIRVIAPPGTVVNALPPAPVAGGNVETSQRIVDVLLGALAQACPEKVPAASQGTMNNLTIGGIRPGDGRAYTYYETIGGGMGARPTRDGPSAIHSHMTNTLNTPVEALEYAYPLQVVQYAIREGSGGTGKQRGGDGIRRDIRLLADCQVTILSERRRTAPYGLAGGAPGQCGENLVLRGDEELPLPGKGSVDLKTGDILSIRTPGGGGYGTPVT
ncbi:MAG: hydantoinase B/oxoprolinase family protein [Chloroflexi bacterium]|nr:hydantoinase B/oxoprolinase family protein [Chloroflexota bacterium]